MERRSWLPPLAVAAGLAWIAGILLVATQADSDPVGARYDAANRALTVSLVLLLVGAVAARRRVARAGRSGARALTATAIGLGLVLAGNVLEFWGALAAGAETEKTADRLGLADVWWGSTPGWLAFLLGTIVVTVALIVFAVRLGSGASRSQRLAVGAGGVLLSASGALWAVSPGAAAVPAVLFAFSWLVFAVVTDAVSLPAGSSYSSSPIWRRSETESA